MPEQVLLRFAADSNAQLAVRARELGFDDLESCIESFGLKFERKD